MLLPFEDVAPVARCWFSIGALLLLVKIELHNLRGLFGRGQKLPVLDRVLAGLHENGMAADDPRALDVTVGSDDHLDFDFAGDAHAASEFRIHGRDLGLYFASRFAGHG